MWTCSCGCQNIAAGLDFCPVCKKERDVPKAVVGAVPTNASAAPGEPGYVAPSEHEVEHVAEEAAQLAADAAAAEAVAVPDEPAPHDSPEAAQSPEPDVPEAVTN